MSFTGYKPPGFSLSTSFAPGAWKAFAEIFAQRGRRNLIGVDPAREGTSSATTATVIAGLRDMRFGLGRGAEMPLEIIHAPRNPIAEVEEVIAASMEPMAAQLHLASGVRRFSGTARAPDFGSFMASLYKRSACPIWRPLAVFPASHVPTWRTVRRVLMTADRLLAEITKPSAWEAPCETDGQACDWTSEEFVGDDEDPADAPWDMFCSKCGRWRDWSKDALADPIGGDL